MDSYGILISLIVVMGISIWLGERAQRVVERGSFLKGYFLGNRGLGAWALALTATVQSGGTFMGFPSLVYAHGWIVALWIASYMVVPITGFAIFGKRMAQLSRRTGAITVPDLLRERFASPTIGLVTSLLIMFFVMITMVAQFKAGAIVMKLAWPSGGALGLSESIDPKQIDIAYIIGLAIFSLIVVTYTMIGGFLASVWTDLFQSVLMAIGVMLLFFLIVPSTTRAAHSYPTQQAVQSVGPAYASGPGRTAEGVPFLPLGLAISYFFVWPWAGLGAPAGIVRVMACKDTDTMRRSIVLLNLYNLMIYLPLIVICICARSIFPNLPVTQHDEIVPRAAIWATQGIPLGSFLTGLILTAPFGAVMASVSTFLVVIASGIVRDVYQRFLRPDASEKEVKRISHGVIIFLGVVSFLLNLRPANYLQTLIVASGSLFAAAFVMPALMASYWRGATIAGVLWSMLTGSATVIALYLVRGERGLLDIAPIVWGLGASIVAGIVASLLTTPPPAALVSRLFDAQEGSAAASAS